MQIPEKLVSTVQYAGKIGSLSIFFSVLRHQSWSPVFGLCYARCHMRPCALMFSNPMIFCY